MKREGCEAFLLFCTFARLAAGFWKEDGGNLAPITIWLYLTHLGCAVRGY